MTMGNLQDSLQDCVAGSTSQKDTIPKETLMDQRVANGVARMDLLTRLAALATKTVGDFFPAGLSGSRSGKFLEPDCRSGDVGDVQLWEKSPKYREALPWVSKAAHQGHAEAQYLLSTWLEWHSHAS
jgi:TPR repeat protein